jgi:hypothetical protein
MAADATIITFEEVGPAPCCFSSAPTLDTEYTNLGVTFGGGWEVLDQSGNFGVPAISGSNFAAYNTGTAGVTDTLTMTFDSAISMISGLLGASATSNWTISLFLGGNAVGTQTVSNAGNSYTSFMVTGLFDFVTIQGSNYAGVLEDLSFDAAPVPLPAAGWLMLAGLGALAASRRMRR